MVQSLCRDSEERLESDSYRTTHPNYTRIIQHTQRAMSLQDIPLVMTPAEVARLLGIGRNSVYALLRSGALRSIRVGKLLKIPRAALEEYLQGY